MTADCVARRSATYRRLVNNSEGSGTNALTQASTTGPSAVTVAEANAHLAAALPSLQVLGIAVDHLELDLSIARFTYSETWIRPGGKIVNGPALMALADVAVYTSIFTRVGIVPMAVTNELKINFLRPAVGCDVLARGRLLKLGRRVAYASVDLFEEDRPDRLVAHATSSYVMPDERALEAAAGNG